MLSNERTNLLRAATDMAITVHLIPHTHTDPGWLDTYDRYYGKDVRPILSNVLAALEADGNRTFVWAETIFLARYYAELSERKKAALRMLVAEGRLEIVGGGWVQHDEALPTVGGMLESMAEGHAWLHSTFGVRPSVGWQLDPFGHSSASAALLGRMGFKALVINRIHYRLKERWRSSKLLEFRWHASSGTLGWHSVLTHVLHTHYATPRGFDFESSGSSVKPLPEAELQAKAESFASFVTHRAQAYRSHQVMVLLGE